MSVKDSYGIMTHAYGRAHVISGTAMFLADRMTVVRNIISMLKSRNEFQQQTSIFGEDFIKVE